MEPLLQIFSAVKLFFLFQSNPPINLKKLFENEFAEAYLWHLHSVMLMFHINTQGIEGK
jgi:hypothetical protein